MNILLALTEVTSTLGVATKGSWEPASIMAVVGLGLMIGLSGAGSAWGLALGGQAVLGMLKKKPDAFGSGMILSAMPATQGLYGFVGYILYSGYVKPGMSAYQGSIILAAGLAVGLAGFFSGIYQGKVCASGIAAFGSGHNVFGNTLILGAFPEFYAILSLVAAILMQGLLKL